MKYVILEKAKPYTRVRRGKLERVKGYAGRLAKYPGVLEEATIHQIRKDYHLSEDEARQMYRDMFGEEHGEKKPFDPVKEHLEWERRWSGKFGGTGKMVVAKRPPQIGDTVLWTGRQGTVGQPEDRKMRVVGWQGNLLMARDKNGLDLMVHPDDLVIIKRGQQQLDYGSAVSKKRVLANIKAKKPIWLWED